MGRGTSNRGKFGGRGNNRGRGGQRTGENDPYDITIAPLNLYKNQVIPVGLHNLSKSFRPNLSTIRYYRWVQNLFLDGNSKKEIMHSSSIKIF